MRFRSGLQCSYVEHDITLWTKYSMSGTQGSKIKKVNMFGIYSHYISPMDFNSNGNSSLVEQFGL